MNHFYVVEGNKRVSVMKYVDAVSIPGNVTRIIPQKNDSKESTIYYEFWDFDLRSPILILLTFPSRAVIRNC